MSGPQDSPHEEEPADGYLSLGRFPPNDARKILDAFSEAGLDFRTDVDSSGLKTASPSDYFSTFGLGVGLNIRIREDQESAAAAIVKTFLSA